ncbi:MAG: adenine deaminase [Methanobacteriaceae archaeon]|nr:adenine deaminase [Methanobacteriaceae archaeon]
MNEKHIKANILDLINEEIYPAEIIIKNGIISKLNKLNSKDSLDYEGILVPGFIDSHIHIESTMLSPANFAKAVLPYGTTSVIADPHEIANVLGIPGVKFMIQNGESVPFDFYFSAPSCVPATNFETNGAILDVKDIEELFTIPNVICLGEMMNFPGVVNDDFNVLEKLNLANKLGVPIDGHAPLLTGENLRKYVSTGISTDHECSSFNEAIEKKMLGVKIMVREGSSAKNMDALLNIKDRINYWTKESKFGNISVNDYEKLLKHPIFDFLVSDDKDPIDLKNGHLDKLIKKTISYDIDPIEAIKMVTLNPAKYYNLNSGEIAEGKKANLVLIDNLNDLNVKLTFINGEIVAKEGKALFEVETPKVSNTFNVIIKNPEDFEIKTHIKNNVNVKIIEAIDSELITHEITDNLKVQNEIIQPDIEKDILKISIVERYGHNNVSNGFIKGFGLKNGAIATSVAHDSHNIIVVGTNSKDMANAVNIIIKNQGGLSVSNGNIEKSLKLPIAGLMSDENIDYVSKNLINLINLVKKLGSNLEAPFMTLSFMALLVIPDLKLSDQGLFSLNKFGFIDLIAN